MTRDRSVDQRISDWLHEEAPDQLPDRVLQATFERTSASRQRRTLLGWRHLPMNRIGPGLIAVGAAAIVVLTVGVALLPRSNPSVGGGSSAPPSGTPASSPSPSSNPSPTLSPISLTGQIAFERTVDGNTDIYLMNLDRTGLLRLTDDPAKDGEPSWSADGRQIAFTRGSGDERDVYLMNADGSGEVRLTSSVEGEEGPSFSFDGSQVAFLRYQDPTFFDLFVIDVDGSNERRVYHREGPYAAHPVWSLDGRALYFNIDGAAGGKLDVARLDISSGDLTLLTDFDGDDSTFALSRDGSTIAFQSDRSPGGIFLMNADGTNVRHLLTGARDKGYPLSWSPDGHHLAYWQDGWLYLVPSSGGEPVKWTEGDGSVAWRPAP
jgi:Tol biopolymer transport system component